MFRKLIIGAAALAVLVTAPPAHPQQRPATLVPQHAPQSTQSLTLPIGKSQTISVNQPVSKIVVGNSDIADTGVLSDRSFYIFGKKVGSTNISVYGAGGHPESARAELFSWASIVVRTTG